jgi:5'-deoxynucleotidase YfbR-like HD superfamily hydrolase
MSNEIEWKKFLIDDHADVKRLDYVIRYSSIPSTYQESVSQHSFWVTLHSIMVHKLLCANYPKDGFNSPEIELSILKKALVHDLPEAITGDLVRTYKYSMNEFKKMADKAEDYMVQKYFPESLKSLIGETYIPDETKSKYVESVVKAADFISLFHYMNREHNRGNKEILPFLNRMKLDMKMMSDKSTEKNNWYDLELSRLYSVMAVYATHLEEDREV